MRDIEFEIKDIKAWGEETPVGINNPENIKIDIGARLEGELIEGFIILNEENIRKVKASISMIDEWWKKKRQNRR